MSPMNVYDLALLRAAGFVAGFSGQSWFGEDRNGNDWQAHIDERTSILMFRAESGDKWGPYGPLLLADFDKLFTTGE